MKVLTWYQRSGYLDREQHLLNIPKRKQLIEQAVQSNDRVLDVGCLGGALTEELAKKAYVVGLDILPEALLLAKERGLVPVYADAEITLPFRDSSFDVIHAGELVEHVFDTEGLFSELYRLLRPGGLLLGTVPNIASASERARLLLGRAPVSVGAYPSSRGGSHVRAFTLRALADLAENSGFSIVDLEGIITGGSRAIRIIKSLRISFCDLIFFQLQKPTGGMD